MALNLSNRFEFDNGHDLRAYVDHYSNIHGVDWEPTEHYWRYFIKRKLDIKSTINYDEQPTNVLYEKCLAAKRCGWPIVPINDKSRQYMHYMYSLYGFEPEPLLDNHPHRDRVIAQLRLKPFTNFKLSLNEAIQKYGGRLHVKSDANLMSLDCPNCFISQETSLYGYIVFQGSVKVTLLDGITTDNGCFEMSRLRFKIENGIVELKIDMCTFLRQTL